uniref:Uncharacterized protein n=1 Tax=Triticum urartu TaxID=4572 RepID=A0A8R7UGS6_TRIUA
MADGVGSPAGAGEVGRGLPVGGGSICSWIGGLPSAPQHRRHGGPGSGSHCPPSLYCSLLADSFHLVLYSHMCFPSRRSWGSEWADHPCLLTLHVASCSLVIGFSG